MIISNGQCIKEIQENIAINALNKKRNIPHSIKLLNITLEMAKAIDVCLDGKLSKN